MWFRKKIELDPSKNLSTVELGEKVLELNTASSGKTFLNKDWWYSKVMDWSMKSPEFKTKMFRFVDVFPYLNSGEDLLKHVDEYFQNEEGDLPSLFHFGSTVGQMAPGFVSKSVEKNIKDMARLFITGDSPEDAIKKLSESRKNSVGFTVDLLGELTLSEKEAGEYKNRYLELIERLSKESQKWDEDPLVDRNHLGPIPKVNVSVKMSSLYSKIKVEAWEETKKVLVERLTPIFRRAKELGVFINIDMEHYNYKDLTLEVFEELILSQEFIDYPHWGIVIQAYLKDSYKDCERLIHLAQKRKVGFTVRLVKGAYWDYEVIHAKQNNWPIPVYTTKENSDYNFEKCAKLLLTHYKDLSVALGSHNLRSVCESLVFAKNQGVPKEAFEIQMLYGMADHFKKSFTDLGYRVREYATIGDLIPGMAYLVRRLLENSSNQSFLQNKMKKSDSAKNLLAPPKFNNEGGFSEKDYEFENAPLLDFTHLNHRVRFNKALETWQKEFEQPKTVKPIVDGQEKTSSEKLKRFNPSQSDQLLYEIHSASEELVNSAINSAFEAQKSWSKTEVEKRAQIIEKVADLIEEDRYRLASLQTLEVGKPWAEADGDITEAIDFCRFYAKDMRKLGKPQKVGHAPGEESLYHYKSKGLVAVIAPWNFPLAILCGMTVSALVTGNSVLMKPAEQSSLVALEPYKILIKAGVPAQVCQFLPGLGEKVGRQIVNSEKTSVISFTGSKAVGLEIIKSATNLKEGQRHVKKVVIEMGGKNPLIIDSDADLDQAVTGVLYSAFAFSGQKCSALSRALVLEPIYDRFCERLKEAVKSMTVGASFNPKVDLGPVVDEESYNRIQMLIEENKKLYPYVSPDCGDLGNGHFIAPHVFFEVDPFSPLATEEIFGPVLSVIKVKSLDQAIEIANDSDYALTGGIYSRLPSHIDKVRDELECGNLYINRTITGAMVERHPFGGYKLSGLGSKTGGPDYLKSFMEPRVMTENLVRQGFSPDLL
jgi:RHH-type proline utilization regulon transcriptional repressor/proline dehydrogenase/delta 1-pyrroline-5-carboxylate dehydrogenase